MVSLIEILKYILAKITLLPVENGGTGATSAEEALSNLGGISKKMLYNNTSGTTGTVTLSESVANFNMIEIIVGYSDTEACNSIKVYSPNGKTVDIDGLTVSENTWGASRVRYAISEETMTASNSYKVICSSAHTLSYASNNLYCKQVIGYK